MAVATIRPPGFWRHAGVGAALVCAGVLSGCGGDDDELPLPHPPGTAGQGAGGGLAGEAAQGGAAGVTGEAGDAGRLEPSGGTGATGAGGKGAGGGGAGALGGTGGTSGAGAQGGAAAAGNESGGGGEGGIAGEGGVAGEGEDTTGGTGGTTGGTGVTGGTGGTAGAGAMAGSAQGGSGGADPCAGVECSGHGSCTIVDGFASCACSAGYEKPNDDPTACVDVDECALSHGGCDPRTTCTNLPGSRACGACPPTYEGTGETACVPSPCAGTPDATCACIKVAPDGDDALAESSGGVLPFFNVGTAIDYAAAHTEAPRVLCVAEGSACGMQATYPVPSGTDLAMRDGVSVYGNYESATWSRCAQSGTTLVPGSAAGVYFGPSITRATVLDGFAIARAPAETTTGVTLDGAHGAVVSNVDVGRPAQSATTTYGIDAKNGADATLSGIVMGQHYPWGPPNQVGIRAVGARVLATGCDIQLLSAASAADGQTFAGLWLEDSPDSALLASNISLTGSVPAIGIHALAAPGLTLDGTTVTFGRIDAYAGPLLPAEFSDVPGLSWQSGSVSVHVPGQLTSAISLKDSPGARLGVALDLGIDYTTGIDLTGDASGTVLDGSITGTGAAYGAGLTIDGCGGASPLIRTRVSVLQAPRKGEAISVSGDCSPTISASADVRIRLASIPGYPQQDLTAIHCRTPSHCTIDHAEATITGGNTPYGSFLRTWGIACDPGACPTIVGSAASGLSTLGYGERRDAQYTGGGISAPGATLVSGNTASALCTGGNGAGMIASGRIENNVISGPTCGATYLGALPENGAGPINKAVGLEVAGSAVVHSNSITGAGANDCQVTACFPLPPCRAAGAVASGSASFMNNLISGGCGPNVGILIGDPSGSVISALHNDLTGAALVAHGDPLMLVSTTTITTTTAVNSLAGASGNFSGGSVIDAGTTVAAPLTDKDGIARDASPDVGPYEATGSPSVCLGEACSDHGVCQFSGSSGGCVCDPIYTGSHCELVNQCSINHGGCDPLTICTPNGAGRLCGSCPSGYTGDGTSGCVDIDECQVNHGGCDPLTTCTNTPGGRTCGPCPGQCGGTGASGCTLPVPPGDPFVQLSAGLDHTCGLTSLGGLECWGNGVSYYGSAPPVCETFDQVSAGASHTCAVRTDGSLECFGYLTGQTPSGTFTAVSAGGNQDCALRPDGTIQCWGTDFNHSTEPPSGTFVQIAIGGLYGCALRSDGTVACWGDDFHGQSDPPSGTFTAIRATYTDRTCALRTDGKVLCWGYAGWDYLTPPDVAFVALEIGASQACGQNADRTLTCWGDGGGIGPPPAVPAKAFTLGDAWGCLVKDDDSVVCWGPGDTYGQADPPP